jgi:formylglycine-generating enzyme required for sulfatase activity
MGGNLSEWCADPWEEYPWKRMAAGDIAPAPTAGATRWSLRGGNFNAKGIDWARGARRGNRPFLKGDATVGFRCVRDL